MRSRHLTHQSNRLRDPPRLRGRVVHHGRGSEHDAAQHTEFDALPVVVRIETAARVLGIIRTLAYRLAKADLGRCVGQVQTGSPRDPVPF